MPRQFGSVACGQGILADLILVGTGKALEGGKVRQDLGPEGIQVDVSGQFEEVKSFLHDYGLVAVQQNTRPL